MSIGPSQDLSCTLILQGDSLEWPNGGWRRCGRRRSASPLALASTLGDFKGMKSAYRTQLLFDSGTTLQAVADYFIRWALRRATEPRINRPVPAYVFYRTDSGYFHFETIRELQNTIVIDPVSTSKNSSEPEGCKFPGHSPITEPARTTLTTCDRTKQRDRHAHRYRCSQNTRTPRNVR